MALGRILDLLRGDRHKLIHLRGMVFSQLRRAVPDQGIGFRYDPAGHRPPDYFFLIFHQPVIS